jgi:hypothetical protein
MCRRAQQSPYILKHHQRERCFAVVSCGHIQPPPKASVRRFAELHGWPRDRNNDANHQQAKACEHPCLKGLNSHCAAISPSLLTLARRKRKIRPTRRFQTRPGDEPEMELMLGNIGICFSPTPRWRRLIGISGSLRVVAVWKRSSGTFTDSAEGRLTAKVAH